MRGLPKSWGVGGEKMEGLDDGGGRDEDGGGTRQAGGRGSAGPTADAKL